MPYTSSTFIFIALSGLLVAAFLPLRLRIFWMIALSLGWFATWNVYLPLILIVLITIHHLFAMKKMVWSAVLFTISAFILFRTFQSSLAVGCSFYLLILLGYTIDVSNRKNELLSWKESLLMGSFFPLMMSGPVVRSDSFASCVREDRMSWESFFDGVLIFGIGYLKFILFHEVFTELSGYWKHYENWMGFALSALFATFNLYVSLSSFADMGRGVARAFGIFVTPSFRSIFFARDPSDFWERWNLTVAGWFRDYLVFPSLLKWGRKVPAQLIVFFAFVILGLWHGLEMKWLIFGIFNGLMVIVGSALRMKFGNNFSGRILIFILVVGNGLLQIAPDATRLGSMYELYPTTELPALGFTFYLTIFMFIAFEWIQEKKGENDFFLNWQPRLKQAIAIGLFILWVFLAEHREPLDPETLPLYFNL